MKILLATHVFAPEIGGIETMSAALAQEFTRQGHDVKVVTPVPSLEVDRYPYEVVRQPSARQLLTLTIWCDVYFHNNISLQTAWPVLLTRRPWVVAHQTWIARLNGSLGWQDHLKRFLCQYATNIAISQAVADSLPTQSTVIGNFYRDEIFQEMPAVERNRELVFVGRLVSDKGVDTLLEALALLQKQDLTPHLTVIGTGPELHNLQELAKNLQIASMVDFAGVKAGLELVRLLNTHQIMVVPSRWQEPFGIVALEGIACGCVVVASEGGGLKDAVGPCGITFPNGDPNALANALTELLSSKSKLCEYKKQSSGHLAKHKMAFVADAYLQIFENTRR